MLVTFSCKAYENITMFGEVAKRLLKIMGHSAIIPGALTAKEVPEALSRLQAASRKQVSSAGQHEQKEDDEEHISLAQRAFPLIAMLEAASKEDCSIMWK